MGPLTSVLRFVETLPGKIVLCASVMAASLGVVVAAGVVADTASSGPALAAVQTEQSFTLSFADSDDDDDDEVAASEEEEEDDEEADSDDDGDSAVVESDDGATDAVVAARVRRRGCGRR